MCTCCGEMVATLQNVYGDWLCLTCLDIEDFQDVLDNCVDQQDSLSQLEDLLLNGAF